MRRVYLDNNATTRVDPRVLETMSPHFLQDFGNASSIHEFGQHAREAVETARQAVADLVGSLPKEIIFTSGGTESDNTAIRGIAARHSGEGAAPSSPPPSSIPRSCGPWSSWRRKDSG